MKLFLIILLSLLQLSSVAEEESIRTWTSADGRKLDASLIEKVGQNVKIRNTRGQEFTIPLIKLSQEDQNFVKEAANRLFFQTRGHFKDGGRGGVIIASLKGEVSVIENPFHSSSKMIKPEPRSAIIGESLKPGSTILTGNNSEVYLLFTSGSFAKIGPDAKLILSAFWQEKFSAVKVRIQDLNQETSTSRIALNLEMGDLVLEVKKKNLDSSFLVESPFGVAGIRGTKLALFVDSDLTTLSVLEGKVEFMDTKQRVQTVETAEKVDGSQKGSGKTKQLTEEEGQFISKAIFESRELVSRYDLRRLMETVEGYSLKSNFTVKSVFDLEMIWCSPGGFFMGDDGVDSTPYPVILTRGFYLGKHEVTQKQFQEVMGLNPSEFKGADLPVENISWEDAMAFCEKLNRMESKRKPKGWDFTLPTEAQWEYACRASTTTLYSFGNFADPKFANYSNSRIQKTSPVGSYPPNPWGFMDFHGNVSEWCYDWMGPLPNYSVTNPIGPKAGTERIIRGGNWNSTKERMLSSNRSSQNPSYRWKIFGFRIALAQH